jgi:hypothetical protein
MPEHVPFPSLPNGFTEFRMHAHSFIFFGGAFGNAAVAKQALTYSLAGYKYLSYPVPRLISFPLQHPRTSIMANLVSIEAYSASARRAIHIDDVIPAQLLLNNHAIF